MVRTTIGCPGCGVGPEPHGLDCPVAVARIESAAKAPTAEQHATLLARLREAEEANARLLALCQQRGEEIAERQQQEALLSGGEVRGVSVAWCSDHNEFRAEANNPHMVVHGKSRAEAVIEALADQVDELRGAAPVVWGPTGMDRLHVASGTVWSFIDGLNVWCFDNGDAWGEYGRDDDIAEWSWRARVRFVGDGPECGTADTEHEAIEAALKAMGGN